MENEANGPDVQNVLDVLMQLHNGTLLHDIAENLQAATLKTRELRKQTEVTIKLTFSPAAAGDIAPVLVKGQTTLKVPPIERGATILFSSEQGYLSRNDPRQQDFFASPVRVVTEVRQAPEPAPLAQAVGDETPARKGLDRGTGEIFDD